MLNPILWNYNFSPLGIEKYLPYSWDLDLATFLLLVFWSFSLNWYKNVDMFILTMLPCTTLWGTLTSRGYLDAEHSYILLPYHSSPTLGGLNPGLFTDSLLYPLSRTLTQHLYDSWKFGDEKNCLFSSLHYRHWLFQYFTLILDILLLFWTFTPSILWENMTPLSQICPSLISSEITPSESHFSWYLLCFHPKIIVFFPLVLPILLVTAFGTDLPWNISFTSPNPKIEIIFHYFPCHK